MQPTSGSRRPRPLAFFLGCVHVQRDHVPGLLAGCAERGVVGEPQVAPEPDDRRVGVVHGCIIAQRASGAMWERTRVALGRDFGCPDTIEPGVEPVERPAPGVELVAEDDDQPACAAARQNGLALRAAMRSSSAGGS